MKDQKPKFYVLNIYIYKVHFPSILLFLFMSWKEEKQKACISLLIIKNGPHMERNNKNILPGGGVAICKETKKMYLNQKKKNKEDVGDENGCSMRSCNIKNITILKVVRPP